MTDYSRVGPITTSRAENPTKNSKYGVEGTDSIRIRMPHYAARQIQGLYGKTSKNKYGNISITSTSQWGLLPIDGSTYLTDNDDITHRYYGLLDDVTVEWVNNNYVDVNMDIERVCNIEDYLCMDYTRGVLDGTEINHGYTDTTTTYNLEEPFTTFDTTNTWYAPIYKSNFTGAGFTVSSGKLQCVGSSLSDGTWAGGMTCSRNAYYYPYIIDFDLEWVAQPTTGNYNHNLALLLYDRYPATWSEYEPWTTSANWIGVYLVSSVSNVQYYLIRKLNGTITYLTTGTVLATGEKTPEFRMTISEAGYLTLSVDKKDDGSYVQLWGPATMGTDLSGGAWVTYGFQNMDGTSATMKSSYINIYNYTDAIKPNVVTLPPGATLKTSADFTRPSEEGNINCYENPNSGGLYFQSTAANYYNGAVKAYNSNYTDDSSKLITNIYDVLDPLEFHVKNGIIDLETTTDSVLYSYWNGSNYVQLNEFTTGTIHSLRPTYISPSKFQFKINSDIYVTMWMGKPFIELNHPSNDVGYDLKTCYYNGTSTTTDPIAGATIDMEYWFYCNVWNRGTGTCSSPNPTDRYRLQIIRQNQEDIKSDSIPASERTGIGHYDSNIASTDQNGYLYNAREYWKQVEQNVIFKLE